jgi:choline kinase
MTNLNGSNKAIERDTIAIILLAGVAKRMAHTLPKSLLSLTLPSGEQTTFVERNIELLLQAGLSKVILVVSQQNQQHFAFLQSDSVQLVLNHSDVINTGSSLSFVYGLDYVRKGWAQNPNILLMDGDIIFDTGLLPFILSQNDATEQGLSYDSGLFYTTNISHDIEEVRVYNQDSMPVLIGKGLNEAVTAGMTLAGESLGIILIGGSDLEKTYQVACWLCGNPLDAKTKAFGYAKERSEHEEIWQYLFNLKCLQVIEVPKQTLFSECDNRDDYQNICDDLLAKIIERDALIQKELIPNPQQSGNL